MVCLQLRATRSAESLFPDQSDHQSAESEAAAEAENEISEQTAALEAELAAAQARIAELEAATPAKEETELDASGIPIGGVAASAIEDAQKPGVAPALLAFKTPKKR